ncbi:MAG: PAS domain S-box protein [Desulfobacterota bacterium]|nr:PAS domain S-box protein [Thermodesulfobacteriota bacterium]
MQLTNVRAILHNMIIPRIKSVIALVSDMRSSTTCIKLFFMFIVILMISGILFGCIAISLLKELGADAISVNEKTITHTVQESLLNIMHERSETYDKIFQKYATATSYLAAQTAAVLDIPLSKLPDSAPTTHTLVRMSDAYVFENPIDTDIEIQFWGQSTLPLPIQKDILRLIHIEPLLKSIKNHNPEVICAYIITSSGIKYQYTRRHKNPNLPPPENYYDVRNTSLFMMATPALNPEKTVRWSYIYLDDITGNPKISVISPIYDNLGEFLGIAALDINLQTIITNILKPEITFHKNHMLASAIPFVLDAQGSIIALEKKQFPVLGISDDNSTISWGDIFFVKRLSDSSLPEIRSAEREILDNHYKLTTLEIHNSRYILCSHTLRSTGWRLCILLPEEKLLGSIHHTRSKLQETITTLTRRFGVGVAALMLCYAASILFLFRTFIVPLKQLTAATKRLATGDYTVRINSIGNGEFLILRNAFNNMVRALQEAHERECEYTERLRQEVLRQTEILQIRAQQLEVANAELRESQKRLSLHIQQTMLGIIEWDTAFKVVAWNPAAEKIFGYPCDQALHRHAFELIVPHEEQQRVQSVWTSLLNTKQEAIIVNRNMTQKGDQIYCEWYASPLIDDHGTLIGVLSLCRDITDRIKREKEKALLSSVIEQTSTVVVIFDATGCIEYINPAAEKLLGYKMHEAVGINPFTSSNGTYDYQFYQKIWETISSGFVWAGTLTHTTKKGATLEIETTISPIVSPNGDILGYAATGRDVTGELELKKQLQQAQKLEAIGTLAGGIAHDFNNILTVIIGFTELSLLKRCDAEVENNLKNILTAGTRAKKLVERILTFSRQNKELRIRAVSLNAIVKETMQFLRASIPTTIDLCHVYEAEHDTVMGDPTQLQQILINLCTNAKQALQNRAGRITVSLSNKYLSNSESPLYCDVPHSMYVALSVHDTGCGIDPTVIDRIFDPFFTTKPPGEGTGLGLSVVHGIVKRYGGHITVSSKPNQGTLFTIYLPVVHTHERAPRDNKFEIIHPGTESILVVDDEQAITVMLQELLESFGYTVVTRTSSVEALELFRAQPGRFDVVITDQTMPNMTGVELAQHISKIRSDIPIILCTGFSEILDATSAREFGISAFLTKPVVISTLTKTIRSVLRDKRAKLSA